MQFTPVALAAMLIGASANAQETEVQVERVSFPSRDGETNVTGYLFTTASTPAKAPAVVMMHGRSGAYSTLSKGIYDATTLSSRHKAWGKLFAREGYVALMVDDFGSLGFPEGFGLGSYKDRPEAADEVEKRPLHAYGALRYLRSRSNVDGARVALLGWSNGGSATLAAMANDKVGNMREIGFALESPSTRVAA